MKHTHATIAVAALIACTGAWAQSQPLPQDISGRWAVHGGRATQTFALEGIQRQGDAAFTAKLTWWTMDSRCAVRGEPITGRITAAGLAFDAATKCDVPFSAELQRSADGWQGQATTHKPPLVTVDLKAN